jgi:hypothetical protein
MLSRTFIERIKLNPEPAYLIAHRAGLHPATLSKLLSGAERIKPNDQRVIAVGVVLGLAPNQCFAEGDQASGASTETS